MPENPPSSGTLPGDQAKNEAEPSLTAEQRAFAEVLGREIARHWKERVELLERGIHSRA
jgi:hypothetical protein